MKKHTAGLALARGAFFAAALLISLLGTPCKADENVLTIDNCQPEQEAIVQAALDQALSTVDGCLININRTMARAIQTLTQRGRVSIACEEVASSHGARTEHQPRGKVSIFVNLASTSPDQKPISARLFHELIHAVDPQDRYLISPAAHNNAGFPDPVYGCQYACYGGVGAAEGDYVRTYARTNQITLAEYPDFPCAGIPSHFCPVLRKYAQLCKTGLPPAIASPGDAQRRSQLPGCILGALVERCAAPCRDIQAKVRVLEAPETNSETRRATRQELLALASKLARALSLEDPADLTESERGLYRVAQRGHYYQTCLE